jgi:alanine racemase
VAEEDAEFTNGQLDLFEQATAGLNAPMRHAANTAGAVLYPRARFQMVRPGIGLYGLHPGPATRGAVELRPAMSIVSHVAFVRELEKGARPSYGRLRPLPEDGRVATVPIGYGDGLPRSWMEGGGEVLIGGRRHPLAGQVTMDHIVADVGSSQVSVGDEVVLLGRQGDGEIGADEWAARLGTINYEIVCQVGPRLPRRYRR